MTSTGNDAADGGFAPLHGVRIADFSSNLAGPYATMILAQLGADVVKVEPPRGDDGRAWVTESGQAGLPYKFANVGKRGMVIDLKRGVGRDVALRLIADCDVVLQSMRPGVADRLGIGADAALQHNPEVLYYDVSAFGSGSVGRQLKGYDPLVQAYTGIMDMTGHDGTPPTRCAPSIIDLGTGQWVAMGILAALLAKECGQAVTLLETALVDTAFSLVGYQASASRLSGMRPTRAGSGNPIAAPYQCFRADDGYILIAAPSQRLWENFVRALEAPQLLEDERFRTVQTRSQNRHALEESVNQILGRSSVGWWGARLDAEGVPFGLVKGLEEAVVDDVAEERETFLASGEIPLVRLPWLVGGRAIGWRRPAPELGEHTTELLQELGYNEGDIESLLASGAVISAA